MVIPYQNCVVDIFSEASITAYMPIFIMHSERNITDANDLQKKGGDVSRVTCKEQEIMIMGRGWPKKLVGGNNFPVLRSAIGFLL